jgi:hypothetical protein
MQAEQSDQPVKQLPVHTKARLPAEKAPKNQRIGKKLAAALRELVFEGKDIAKAAQSAGLTGHALRCALAKPHVIQALKRERDVFHAFARAGNIHALLDVRQNSRNDNARVAAAKVIENSTDERQSAGVQTVPGLTVVVVQAASITADDAHSQPKPLIINGSVSRVDPIHHGTDRDGDV